MPNKTILITGATNGIGKQTALALARQGAHVIVTGRSEATAATAVDELKQSSGNQQIGFLLGDLSTQAGVRSLADAFSHQYERLDVLINNAGLAEAQRRLTEDGIEADFAVNVVAPFLLTRLLMPQLQASPAARVISVTGGEHPKKIELDNLQSERSFVGLTTYSHAKLVMMAVMYEFAQRVQGTDVAVNVCYPGQASTSMTRSVTADMFPTLMRPIWPMFKWFVRDDGGKSAAKASRSSVYLASSDEVERISGRYYNSNCKSIDWPKPVLDPAVREKMWATVEEVATQSGTIPPLVAVKQF